MHKIFPNKIIYIPDGTHDYEFECVQPNSALSGVSGCVYLDAFGGANFQQEMALLSEVQREICMWKLFETHIIPRLERGEITHLNGSFTKKIYNYTRQLYRESGYFREQDNRFCIPSTARITLGIHMIDLSYQSKNISGIYLSQGAIRANIAALNDGCIARIYIQMEHHQELASYLQQSHVQLPRLVAALGQGWPAVTPTILSSFTLRAPSPSWPEVLSE